MDDNKLICYCRNVSYGDIKKAIEEGAITVEEIQKKTKAGYVCGRCVSRIKEILEN
ncbi:MAG: (2Fe-2S)-binding protein [Sarcina sp.]